MKAKSVVRWIPAVAGTLVVIATLVALFPRYLYHWDEIQLTLGLAHFDLRAHQPHPPGYYLFIVLGRLLQPFFVEPANALRMTAALAAASFVSLVAACLPAGRGTGRRPVWVAAAALFVLASPIVLFHAVSALTYTCEAAAWLAVALALGLRPRGGRLALLAFGIGVAGGFRQTLIVWGLALALVAWLFDRAWLDLRGALRFAAGLAAGVLVWAVPMLVETGGWREYVTVSVPVLEGNVWEKTIFHEGSATLLRRLSRMPRDLWLAAGPWIPVAAAGLWMRFRSPARERLARRDLLLVAAAVSFVFYLVLIYDSAGYILAVAFPLVAWAMLVSAELWPAAWSWAAPLLSLSLLLLPGGPVFAGERGYPAYAEHDAMVARRVEAIKRGFDPRTTVLVTSHEYWQWSFRHVMYYLPEFTTIQLLPDHFFADAGPETPYLTASRHRIRFSGPDGLDVRGLGPSVGQVVYVIPHDVERFVTASCAPVMRPLYVTPDERLPVIDLSRAEVRIGRSQLHCRPL